MGTDPAQRDPQHREGRTTKECEGLARVLRGNHSHIGRRGAFTPRRIAADSAVTAPEQFGTTTAGLRRHAPQISGTVEIGQGRTFSFSNVADVIGGQSPIPGVGVRDALRTLNPGKFIIELPDLPNPLPGRRRRGGDPGIQKIKLTIPSSLECPEGTEAVTT